jgi:S1-C subfamily serine protease
VAVLLILVAVLLFRMTDGGTTLLNDPNAVSKPPTARGELTSDELTNVNIARKVIPAVVQVISLSAELDQVRPDETPSGTGSGFVWDAKGGYIVTNYHVVQGADQFKVTLHNKLQCEAVLIGTEPEKDIAVLKVLAPHPRLHDVQIGRSSELELGWKVLAVGYPFGWDHTLTTGIISGLGRPIITGTNSIIDGIQTDAAIYPGNSGGPLVDSEGRVIGMNTAVYPQHSGFGFAVPIDTVNHVVPKLIRYGTIDRVGLGIAMINDTKVHELVEKQLLNRAGVLFYDVLEGSPADRAGLVATRVGPVAEVVIGDLILAINGAPTPTTTDLLRMLDSRSAGATMTVTIHRDGKTRDVEVTLERLQPPEVTQQAQDKQQ